MTETTDTAPVSEIYLNCAAGFWQAYSLRPGSHRRHELLKVFKQHPLAILPVNNKWQANLADPDLKYLLKKGFLLRRREGGCAQHAMNKKTRKRQTYLILATASNPSPSQDN